MDEADDPPLGFGDDQAFTVKVDRAEGVDVKFVHAQRACARGAWNSLVPELPRAGESVLR